MEQITSIIILSCNTLRYTQDCIESIREHTAPGSYELIVIDNASTDGSAEWLQGQADVRGVFNAENMGFPKGCNQGMEIASGGDFLLLNSDTVVTAHWLENMQRALHSGPEIGAVGCMTNNCSNFQRLDVNYQNMAEMQDFARSYNQLDSRKWHKWMMLVGFCFLFKREIYEKLGGLDEVFSPGNFEDDDYSFRIREAGYELLLCEDTFIHHIGGASFVRSSDPAEQERKRQRTDALLLRNRKIFADKWHMPDSYDYKVMHSIIFEVPREVPRGTRVLLLDCNCAMDLCMLARHNPGLDIVGITASPTGQRLMDGSFSVALCEDMGDAAAVSRHISGLYDYIIYLPQAKDIREMTDYVHVLMQKGLRVGGTFLLTDGQKLYTAQKPVTQMPQSSHHNKIVTISMVKNEMDVIESFVRHTLSFADEMLIADHMSSDRTGEILQALQEEGLPIRVKKIYAGGYIQAEVMDALLEEACREHQADIVVPLDADEFLLNTETEEDCRRYLQQLDPGKNYRLPWRFYEVLEPEKDASTFLLSRPCQRASDFSEGQKIIAGGALFRENPFKFMQGQHLAYRDTNTGRLGVEWTEGIPLHIAHFYWRGDVQFASKTAVGWLGNIAKYSLHTTTAVQYEEGFQQVLRQGTVASSERIINGEQVDLRQFCPQPKLRYSEHIQPDLLRNVLQASLCIAQSCAEERVLQRHKLVSILIPFIGGIEALQASLATARAQLYPYSEILVLVLEAAQADEVYRMPGIDFSRLHIVAATAAQDVFSQLSAAASGEYIQWLFPGDELCPDKLQKMVTSMELQEVPFGLLLSAGRPGDSAWEDCLEITGDEEFIMNYPHVFWHLFLCSGSQPSGGIANALVQRRVMEQCQWLKEGFLGMRPLFLTMWRMLLQDSQQKPSFFAGVLRKVYSQRTKRLSWTERVWKQLEWLLLLEQDRALLSDGEWGQSLQKAEKKAMEICAAAESADDVMDADLWQQYVSQLELLLPAETE